MVVDETVTYLEMKNADQLVPGKVPPTPIEFELQSIESVELIRSTYQSIGEPLYWLARPAWSKSEWEKLLSKESLDVWLLHIDSEVVGMIELEVQGNGNTELSVFGLLPEYVGKGYGGYALTRAIELAWSHKQLDGSVTQRVWVNTSTMDHPHAIQNYKARGFIPYKTEQKQREIPDSSKH